jgi:hypothetical protein
MIKLVSPWSRVLGRASRSLVRGRVKDERAFSEGAILALSLRLFQLKVDFAVSRSCEKVESCRRLQRQLGLV